MLFEYTVLFIYTRCSIRIGKGICWRVRMNSTYWGEKMSVFVNGMFVGSEIYPGVYAEELVGPSWMIRKENEQGWPCRVGEVKGNRDNGVYLACSCLGEVRGKAGSMHTAVRLLLN